MAKIALLSYHFWYNYGTCFQAYALWFALKKYNVDAEYLNFGWRYPGGVDYYLENHYSYQRPNASFLQCVTLFAHRYKHAARDMCVFKMLLRDWILIRNHAKFDAFKKKYIKESDPVDLNNNKEVLSCYEKFIVGSDQVWNPDCADEIYFKRFLLDFVESPGQKFCYAPSIGKDDVNASTERLFVNYLASFSNVCCREVSGCNMLSRLLGKDIQQVLDPTFLLMPEEWREVANYPDGDLPFVLCYILGDKKCIVQYALNLARALGIGLRVVTENFQIISGFGRYVVGGVGPCEFIGLIDRCQFVVTDSFHGCALAINFNKSLRAFLKRSGGETKADNARIPSLLSQFEIKGCLCSDDAGVDTVPTCYITSNALLRNMRKTSARYLKSVVLGQGEVVYDS